MTRLGGEASGRRLLLIGLDAADREFIAAHADVLPNICGILADGAGGPLASEPMAGAVWPSFFTGGHPEEHAIFHHLQWDPDRMRVRRVNRDWLPTRPFWRDLGARGVAVTAFDAPFVFPDQAPNVLEVMNWGSHDLVGPFWANDPGVGRRFRARFGLHPMGFEVPVDKTADQLQRAVDAIVKGAATRAKAVEWLMRERPWQVFLVGFGETHRAGHTIWPSPDDPDDPAPVDGLTRIYQAVDAAVGEVVRAAGEGTDVILFSLHGMASNSSQSHLTSIFMQRALARFRGDPAPAEQGDAPGLMRELRRHVPAGLQLAIASRVPTFVRDYVIARELGGGYDWARTWGFCLHGDLAGYLRLNIEGREARGAMPPDQVAPLKAYLQAELEALTLPDGRPLVQRVSFPATDCAGPRARYLPDILVEWDPAIGPTPEVHSPTLGVIRSRHATGRGGNHRFRGFYAHSGPRQDQPLRPGHIAELRRLVESLA